MEQRHALEAGGTAVACSVAAAGTFQFVAGAIDWVFVLGIGLCAGIAASANYRARTSHSEQVADEAPTVDAEVLDDESNPSTLDETIEIED
jgi:hypothetical protein